MTELITKDTPRLFKKYNVRVAWADGGMGPMMLDFKTYKHGADAPTESWIFLTPKAEE